MNVPGIKVNTIRVNRNLHRREGVATEKVWKLCVVTPQGGCFGIATVVSLSKANAQITNQSEGNIMFWRVIGYSRPWVMGGGTFFKVGRGTSARQDNCRKIIVVWIGDCDVTSIEIWRHFLHTIWRSKLHCKRIGEPPEIQMGCYRGDPGQQRHSGSSYDLFWLNKTVRRLCHGNFHLLSF